MAALLPGSCTTLDVDQSAALLTAKLRAREPFFFLRYGDGALECMAGRSGITCDFETYTPELGAALYESWRQVVCGENTYVGDWQSASFGKHDQYARYLDQWAQLAEWVRPDRFLHCEALLLMRESAALVDFYRSVKEDPRRKLFIGPIECAGAAKMLGAAHCVIPMTADLHRYFESAPLKLWDSRFEVMLYGAGMAGNVQAVKCWQRFPERTYINIGSALDILFRGRTRRQQLAPEKARALFGELL